MSFTLINARPSPYGRKVAIALIEKGLPYRVQYDVPWGEETCTPDYSPFQQLPILITDQHENIYDSTYILEWLEHVYPEPALLPRDPKMLLYQKLIQMLGERLMETAQTLIFEVQREAPSEAWVQRQTAKIVGGLAELEKQVAGREIHAGEPLMLGDIAAGTTLLAVEFAVAQGYSPDLDAFRWRSRHPGLGAYADMLDATPAFRQTTPDRMDVDLGATVR